MYPFERTWNGYEGSGCSTKSSDNIIFHIGAIRWKHHRDQITGMKLKIHSKSDAYIHSCTCSKFQMKMRAKRSKRKHRVRCERNVTEKHQMKIRPNCIFYCDKEFGSFQWPFSSESYREKFCNSVPLFDIFGDKKRSLFWHSQRKHLGFHHNAMNRNGFEWQQ